MPKHRLSPSGPFLDYALKNIITERNAAQISVSSGGTDTSLQLSMPLVEADDELMVMCSGNPVTTDAGARVDIDLLMTPPGGMATAQLPGAYGEYDGVYGTYNMAIAPMLVPVTVAGTYLFTVQIGATGGDFTIAINQIQITVMLFD